MNTNSHRLHIFCYIALFVSAHLLIAETSDPTAAATTQFSDHLEYHSEWWPEFASVPVEHTFPNVPPIRAGQRAVLIRIEGSEALLDFGRSGVRRFNLMDTDIISRALELSQQPPRKLGLFTATFFNKFFIPSDPKVRQCLMSDFEPFDYFLLIYTTLDGNNEVPIFAAVQDQLDNWPTSLPKPSVLVVPTDTMSEADLLAACKKSEIKWPVMFNFLTRGYRKILHHQIDNQTTLPLIDKNGRLLSTWSEDKPQALSEYLSLIADSIESNIDLKTKH